MTKYLLTLLLLCSALLPLSAQGDTPLTMTAIADNGYRIALPYTWTVTKIDEVLLFGDDTAGITGYLSAGSPDNFDGETPIEMLDIFLSGLETGSYNSPEAVEAESYIGVRVYGADANSPAVIYVVDKAGTIVFTRLAAPPADFPALEATLISIIESVDNTAPQNDFAVNPAPLLLTTVSENGFIFQHPAAWNITDTSSSLVIFGEGEDGVTGFIAGFRPGTRFTQTDPAAIIAEDNQILAESDANAPGFDPIEPFMLNGIPSARGYRDRPAEGVQDVMMVTQRDGFIFMLMAVAATDTLPDYEPVLRAVLASAAVSSTGATPGTINPLLTDEQTLTRTFATEDGRFAFRYPEGWVVEQRGEIIIVSRTATYSTPVPASGEFILSLIVLEELPNIGLRYSPALLLEVLTQQDAELQWVDIETLRVGEWRAAITTLANPGDAAPDWTQFTLQLDEDSQIFLRANALAAPDEMPLFAEILFNMLSSVTFAG